MAKKIVIHQSSPRTHGKLVFIGSFSQKKNSQEALEKVAGDLSGYFLLDDVSTKSAEYNYSRYCNLLTKAGRATILDADKKLAFVAFESIENEIRPFDFDDAGNLQYNPVQK